MKCTTIGLGTFSSSFGLVHSSKGSFSVHLFSLSFAFLGCTGCIYLVLKTNSFSFKLNLYRDLLLLGFSVAPTLIDRHADSNECNDYCASEANQCNKKRRVNAFVVSGGRLSTSH